MQNALDRRTANGKLVGEIVLAPLVAQGISPMIVDVGARSGMFLIPPVLAKQSTLVGFEPNPEEYRKLVSASTDAMKAGLKMPPFKHVRYFDSAVWDKDEEANFYITVGPGACTMMGETMPVAERILRDYGVGDPRTGMSFKDQVGLVKSVVSVKARRLDTLLSPDETIDLLKVDVEGAELRVFQGAQKMFDARNVLFVFTEFVTLPFYTEHPVLGDQHTFMRDNGLRLLDVDFNHSRYWRTKVTIPREVDRPLLHAGDVYFALDPDAHALSAEERQRMALMAFVFGFNSFGMSLLREAKLCNTANLDMIEATLSQVPWGRRLKTSWERFPATAKSWLRNFGVHNASTQ